MARLVDSPAEAEIVRTATVSYNPVFRIPELEHALATTGRRPVAFVLLAEGKGETELRSWLSSRYPSERADFLGKQYRIFHIHDELSVSMERRETSR